MLSRAGTMLGSMVGRVRSLVLLGILLMGQAASAGPTFVVNSTADVPAGPNTTDAICETATGNGVCTLRAAIMEANATQNAIVRVPAGFYALTRVPTPGVHPENGDLDVLSSVKIEGDGPGVSVVDASALSRVFRVEFSPSSGPVEMRGLTIQNGLLQFGEGGGDLQHRELDRRERARLGESRVQRGRHRRVRTSEPEKERRQRKFCGSGWGRHV